MVFVSSIGGLQPSMPVNIIHLLSLDSGISTELATVDLSCQGPFILVSNILCTVCNKLLPVLITFITPMVASRIHIPNI